MSRPILILGVGNILLSDDGIGVRLIEAMAEEPCPDHVEMVDGGTAGLDLLDLLVDRRKVIILDALSTADPPGTVRCLGLDALGDACHRGASVHEAGILETLAIARELGRAPVEVVIIGITPKVLEYGLELSAEVAQCLPEAIAMTWSEATTDALTQLNQEHAEAMV